MVICLPSNLGTTNDFRKSTLLMGGHQSPQSSNVVFKSNVWGHLTWRGRGVLKVGLKNDVMVDESYSTYTGGGMPHNWGVSGWTRWKFTSKCRWHPIVKLMICCELCELSQKLLVWLAISSIRKSREQWWRVYASACELQTSSLLTEWFTSSFRYSWLRGNYVWIFTLLLQTHTIQHIVVFFLSKN